MTEELGVRSAEFLYGRCVTDVSQCDACYNVQRDCWENLAKRLIRPLRVSTSGKLCILVVPCEKGVQVCVWADFPPFPWYPTTFGLCTFGQPTHCDVCHVYVFIICRINSIKIVRINKVCLCLIFHMH